MNVVLLGSESGDRLESRYKARNLCDGIGVHECVEDFFPSALVLALERYEGEQAQQALQGTLERNVASYCEIIDLGLQVDNRCHGTVFDLWGKSVIPFEGLDDAVEVELQLGNFFGNRGHCPLSGSVNEGVQAFHDVVGDSVGRPPRGIVEENDVAPCQALLLVRGDSFSLAFHLGDDLFNFAQVPYRSHVFRKVGVIAGLLSYHAGLIPLRENVIEKCCGIGHVSYSITGQEAQTCEQSGREVAA